MQRVEQVRRGEMLYRRFGNTGVEISVIGLGGSHFAKTGDEAGSIRLVRSAIDRGITFMDNSWDYGAGQSEMWMGKAPKGGYRDKVFLMTKIDGQLKKDAAKTFKPMTQQQLAELLARTQKAAMAGQYERFRTSMRFDGTIKRPEWLGQDQLNESE